VAKTIHSGPLTFIDLTDTKKVDVHILSNLPTIQIYNANTNPITYSPDWTKTPLKLTLTAYADSTNITNILSSDDITWYKQIGSDEPAKMQSGGTELTISSNALQFNGVISYICQIKYNNKTFENKITFARTDTGLNGTDGTSITIKGVAYFYSTLTDNYIGSLISLRYENGNILDTTGLSEGDSYVVQGYLCTYSNKDGKFICVGRLQGQKGEDAKGIILTGTSQVFKVTNNAISPSEIVIAASKINFTEAIEWSYRFSDDKEFTILDQNKDYITADTDTKIRIIGEKLPSDVITIKAKEKNGSIEDVFTVYKAIDGNNGDKGDSASIAFLTNENITFAANSNGEVTATKVDTHIVAYNGTKKVMPVVGAIDNSLLPNGMTVSVDSTTYAELTQEVVLTVNVAANKNLGSTSSNHGTISIPITYPVETSLLLSWSKINSGSDGKEGVGIDYVEIKYGTSQTIDSPPISWENNVSDVVVPDGHYLWTRTKIDYTDSSKEDTITYTYTKQGEKGSSGDSINVQKVEYCAYDKATVPPTNWSDTIVGTSASNPYLWTKTTFSDGEYAYSVARYGLDGAKGDKGDQGDDGVGIASTTVTYGVSDSSSTQPASWQNTIPTVADGKYLWTRTVIDYTDTTRADTVSYTYAKQGTKGSTGSAGSSVTVSSIQYQAGTSATTAPTGTWSNSVVSVAEGNYLWTKTTFSDGKTAYGVAKQGKSGSSASLVDITPSAHYFKSTTGKDGTFTPDYIYLYPRFQTVTFSKWQYSVNGGTTWVDASGANGLNVGEYSSVKNTLRISKTSTLYTDTVTSISFRCVSSNTAVYDTVTIAKIYDVVDLELGVTFQLYAPKGCLITNEIPEVTLQTFAHEGSKEIANATFKWYSWSGENWTEVNNSTTTSLVVNKNHVLKSNVYKCEMTYNGKIYEATATVEDKTDVYESLIRVTAKHTSNNGIYWILYATVYSEEGERDALLGPVSETAPASPVTGAYWYQIDKNNYSIILKKYSGTAWVTSTDKQELLYDWLLFKDITNMVSLGDKSKVKIVKSGDFVNTCNVQCNIFDTENNVLSRNNQVLNDPTDPIVSETAPENPIDGQIWIQISENSSYILSVWNAGLNKWILSSADTQNKVYVTKPSQYNVGDLWIVDSNYSPTAYENGVMKDYKHPEKTMLKAIATSQIYSDAHWVEALKYQKELDGVVEDVEKFKQFISIDDTGLILQAKGANNTISDFKTILTNTELGFYQGSTRVAYINNNQLNISKAEITNGLTVSGTTPTFKIGNFTFIQESNGSLSIG